MKHFIEHNPRWKYSEIEGDVMLGPKPYCYLTGYDTDPALLLHANQHAAAVLVLKGVNLPLVGTDHIHRIKIEEILYDTKTGHDVLAPVHVATKD